MNSEAFRHGMKRATRSAAAKLALISPTFHRLLPPRAKFDRIDYRWGGTDGRLMVFLPGIDDVAEDFVRRGFIDDARLRGVASGAVALDAHYGYYASRTLHVQMREEVVQAATQEGYEKVWMTGISLGGFGAASYAASDVDKVEGMLLLAPYLGDAKLIREIRAAGGAGRWEPGTIDVDDYPRQLWAWLKEEYASKAPRVPIYLGYGEADRFADAHRLLAELIPAERVRSIPGGHDWKTWRQLWQHFIHDTDVAPPR